MNSEKSLDKEISCKSRHAWILRIFIVKLKQQYDAIPLETFCAP